MVCTISLARGFAGGYVGQGSVHPAVLDNARQLLSTAKLDGQIDDSYVIRCGDDIGLVLTHTQPVEALVQQTFRQCADRACQLGLHPGESDDSTVELISLEIDEATQPVVCVLADKAAAGSLNLHLYKLFADPLNTPGLATEKQMQDGYAFHLSSGEVFDTPENLYNLFGALKSASLVSISSRHDSRAAASVSSERDPMALIRCGAGFPSVGEILEPFALAYPVRGWGRDNSLGPLLPVSTNDDAPTRSDGPPRVIAVGFQVADGRLIGPRDLLGDRAFDSARHRGFAAADYLRAHGAFLSDG